MADLFLLFWRITMPFSYNGCTDLHSHQLCVRIRFFPHAQQHLLFLDLLVTAISFGVRILHCGFHLHPLRAGDTKHFLMCLSAIYISCFDKYVFRSLLTSWLDPLCCCWVSWTPYVMDINALSDAQIADTLSHLLVIYSHRLSPLQWRRFLVWHTLLLSAFCSVICALGILSKK